MLLVLKPHLENCILTSYDNSLKKNMLILALIPDVRKRMATLLPIVPCTSLSLYSARPLRVYEEAHIFQQLLEIFKQLKNI